MKGESQQHSYLVLGAAILLALLLLAPYLGIHLFGTQPTVPEPAAPPSRKVTPQRNSPSALRNPTVRPKKNRAKNTNKPVPKRRVPLARDGESLSDIENLLK
jgi:hypothetical protein